MVFSRDFVNLQSVMVYLTIYFNLTIECSNGSTEIIQKLSFRNYSEIRSSTHCIWYIVHHPLHIVHHPSYIVHHPSLIAHHPSYIVHHSSLIVHHPSLIVHRTSSIVHISSLRSTKRNNDEQHINVYLCSVDVVDVEHSDVQSGNWTRPPPMFRSNHNS